MNISVNDTITITERLTPLITGLTQAGLSITSGSTYRLMFDATITSGPITVYQGTQLIYSSAIVFIGYINTLYENVNITEHITLDKRTRINLNDSVTVSENIVLSIYYPGNANDTVTVSENISLTIA
jgi:hypothetical protein